jgi:SEC-C motif-containing protein
MANCPCGNHLSYEKCCGPIISGEIDAPTAEALMRARYTAYVKGEIDFIINSHTPEGRENLSREETEAWSRDSQWEGLTIVGTREGGPSDTAGKVEFKARYIQGGLKNEHHEMSDFEKIEGKWYYKDGRTVPSTVVRSTPKVGRNDPCPCGSGKKYKKCCGAA